MERTLAKSRAERTPTDFGDLTWLRHFDEDDLAEFVSELRQTLSLAYHDDDLASLVDAVADWKATADELADPRAAKSCWAPWTLLTSSRSRGPSGSGERWRVPPAPSRSPPWCGVGLLTHP